MTPQYAQGQFVFGFQPNAAQSINYPKGATPMSKYGDDHVCTCEMNFVSCRNVDHADSCELWLEPSFKSGDDEWDSDLGCLVLARSPWQHPEDFVWDGDNPVVSVQTALDRSTAPATDAEFIGPLEQEAMDALTDGVAETDEFGWVILPDGSFADFTTRVTFRKVTNDGGVFWEEHSWDDGTIVAYNADDAEPVKCTCTPEKKFYCWKCEVERDDIGGEWRVWDRKATTQGVPSTTQYWGRCSHAFETFRLPGRTESNIKISAKRTHGPGDTPDYGLYLYAGWDPKCVGTLLPWQDYGLPTVPFEDAAAAIKYAFDLAESGKIVEVGCMGAHGRTGTVLACMALLADPEMSAKSAIAHVRKVHCHEAIETNEQEWFIEWFKSWLTGCTCPPKPTTYVTKHSANWHAASSAATATKKETPALPLVQQTSSLGGGGTISPQGVWCSSCMRVVYTQHNNDCAFDYVEQVRSMGTDAKVLEFKPEVIQGETANARRKNAKRANRRAARKAKAQAARKANIPQEYV